MANPFKDLRELKRDVETYLRKNRSSIYNNSKRISDFFEMACYNNIVRFYENNGYSIKIANLTKGKFYYKTTTAGNPSNYSYFEAILIRGNLFQKFEIRHNINVQSYHTNNTYTTPDIVIIKPNSILIDSTFYANSLNYYYIKNSSLISFCEVKNFNPYPELLFNFIGVVNELRPNLLKPIRFHNDKHIATSLMMSGQTNSHTQRIVTNLKHRYYINIMSDLFNLGGVTFGRYSLRYVRTV